MVGLLLRHRPPPWEREKRMITLRDSKSDERFGSEPSRRSLDQLMRTGYILLDKPRGPRSQEAMDQIKRVLGVERVGYGGTLGLGAGRSRRLRPPPYILGRLH